MQLVVIKLNPFAEINVKKKRINTINNKQLIERVPINNYRKEWLHKYCYVSFVITAYWTLPNRNVIFRWVMSDANQAAEPPLACTPLPDRDRFLTQTWIREEQTLFVALQLHLQISAPVHWAKEPERTALRILKFPVHIQKQKTPFMRRNTGNFIWSWHRQDEHVETSFMIPRLVVHGCS